MFSGGPWLFDKQVIVFVKPKGISETLNVEFNKVAFWIHILNVPLACLNESCARLWGNEIGELLATEVHGIDMKVRVLTDVTKPLRCGIRVFIEEANAWVTLLLQYEFLPDFCFWCEVIAHKDRECTILGDLDKNVDTARFDPWMRYRNSRTRSGNSHRNRNGSEQPINPTTTPTMFGAIQGSWEGIVVTQDNLFRKVYLNTKHEPKRKLPSPAPPRCQAQASRYPAEVKARSGQLMKNSMVLQKRSQRRSVCPPGNRQGTHPGKAWWRGPIMQIGR